VNLRTSYGQCILCGLDLHNSMHSIVVSCILYWCISDKDNQGQCRARGGGVSGGYRGAEEGQGEVKSALLLLL